jgi:hypothetical protein
VREGKSDHIMVGGMMAGKFTAGLSRGQRQLFLFELIYQRTVNQDGLLIVLDEPFAGVTEDFLPFIMGRLKDITQRHNLLIVTNDHIRVLTDLADNTITVSAVDRTKVCLNDMKNIDRSDLISALSIGKAYEYKSTSSGVKFFFDVEVYNNGLMRNVLILSVLCYGLLLMSFYNTEIESSALVVIASASVAFFVLNPTFFTLPEWRNTMLEEAEALIHSSKRLNKVLKVTVSYAMIVFVSILEYIVIQNTIHELRPAKYFFAIFSDNAFLFFPMFILSVNTGMTLEHSVLLGSSLYFSLMCMSTTFSPGGGLPVLKEFRYLYPRFYFWCMLPGVEDLMEGCLDHTANIGLTIFMGQLGVILAAIYCAVINSMKKSLDEPSKSDDNDFVNRAGRVRDLQDELFYQGSFVSFPVPVDDNADDCRETIVAVMAPIRENTSANTSRQDSGESLDSQQQSDGDSNANDGENYASEMAV